MGSLSKKIEQLLDSYKATDLLTIDISNNSNIADSMIIANGTSRRHLTSMAEKLRIFLKKDANIVTSVEGLIEGNWLLLDCGDLLIHLFLPEFREIYDLEAIWLTSPPMQAR